MAGQNKIARDYIQLNRKILIDVLLKLKLLRLLILYILKLEVPHY